jgi:beta-N-acetylhexosaminidase
VIDLLRTGLGFKGVVVSDDLGSTASVASISAGTRAEDFIAAGGDLIVTQKASVVGAMVAAVSGRAASDAAFRALVDAAALQVLTAKAAFGLLACPV